MRLLPISIIHGVLRYVFKKWEKGAIHKVRKHFLEERGQKLR